MVFTQGRGFVVGALFGLLCPPLRWRVLVCSAADTASLATRFLFVTLLCGAMLSGFGEKRCRKNLPFSAPSRVEKQGVASYWIGNGDTQENLNRLTEYWVSDGGLGDFVPAPFCRALGIEHYEPDYFGGKRFPKQLTKLRLLFHGDPIPQQLMDAWPETPPSNCAVAMFDYEYNGAIPQFEIDAFSFVFLGAYAYS